MSSASLPFDVVPDDDRRLKYSALTLIQGQWQPLDAGQCAAEMSQHETTLALLTDYYHDGTTEWVAASTDCDPAEDAGYAQGKELQADALQETLLATLNRAPPNPDEVLATVLLLEHINATPHDLDGVSEILRKEYDRSILTGEAFSSISTGANDRVVRSHVHLRRQDHGMYDESPERVVRRRRPYGQSLTQLVDAAV